MKQGCEALYVKCEKEGKKTKKLFELKMGIYLFKPYNNRIFYKHCMEHIWARKITI